MSLVDTLLSLALAVVILTAVAASLSAMSSNLRVNQAELEGLRASRATMEFLTSQLRQADECLVYGTTQGSSDTVYPLQVTEISINSGGGDPRPDCNPGDYLEVHVKTVPLAGGQTGLTIWKDSKGKTWNGVTYDPSKQFAIPNVVAAQIICDQSNSVPLLGGYVNVRTVQMQMTVEVTDQNGQKVRVPITASAAIRRTPV